MKNTYQEYKKGYVALASVLVIAAVVISISTTVSPLIRK